MPDIFIYAFIAVVAVIVLSVLGLVVFRGYRPKRGPSSFDHSGIDGDMGT